MTRGSKPHAIVVVDDNPEYREDLVRALRDACALQKTRDAAFVIPRILGSGFIEEVETYAENNDIVAISTGMRMGYQPYGGADVVKGFLPRVPFVYVHSHLAAWQVMSVLPGFPEDHVIQKKIGGIPDVWTDAMMKTIRDPPFFPNFPNC